MTELDDASGDRESRLPAGLRSNLVATATILCLNLATGVLLARAFEPEERGEVALILLWPSILAALAQLGLPEAVTFHTARRTAADGTVLGSGLVIATLRAFVVLIVAASILPLVLGSHGDDVLAAGYVYLGFIPGHAYNLLLLAVLNGQQRYRAVAALRLLVIAGAAIPMFVVFAAGELTLMSVSLLYVGAQLVTFIVSALLLTGTWRQLALRAQLVRDLLHYGVRAHIGTISTSLNARLDKLVVSVFLPVRDLGLYTVAATVSGVTAVIGETIGYVVVPAIARAGDAGERAARARSFASLTLLISLLLTVPAALFTPQLITVVFGDEYAEIAGVARILLIGTVAFSTARCLEAILRAINLPWQASLGELLALGITVVGLAALLPLLGLTGAAIASLLAYSVSMIWMLRLTASRLGLAPVALLVPSRAGYGGAIDSVRRSLERRR